MRVTLIPLTGPWHMRHPRWNVVTVRDALEALTPDAVWTTALTPDATNHPSWQETDEIALPWTVATWARTRGTPLVGLGSAGAAEEADFDRLMAGVAQAREGLQRAQALLEPIKPRLPNALDLTRWQTEILPHLRAAFEARVQTFGDGPATGWRARRAEKALQQIQAHAQGAANAALLCEVDMWAPMVDALDAASIPWRMVEAPDVSAAARERSLLDVAWRGEAADVAGLLGQLRELGHAEALYLQANLLLLHQHPAEALETMERAALSDFQSPYLLPGLLLARLGQLRDLAGKRERALQAYRGALALAWIPAAARAAAEAGMRVPFALGQALV